MAIQSTATPTDLAIGLERRVARLTQLLRSAYPGRRSVTALLTLRRLDAEGPCRITDLAAAENVAQPTMTVLVRRLEDEGLVERTADPVDARAVRIALTAAGRAALAEVREARADVLRRRLDALGPSEHEVLAAALPVLDALLDPHAIP